MSYELTAKILRNPLPGVSGTEKYVLATLADMIDDKGYCYPSMKNLSKRCGFHINTVFNSVKDLEKKGLLFLERQEGTSHKYFINISVLEKYIKKGKKTYTTDVEGVHNKSGGGYTSKGEGVHISDTLIDKGIDKEEKIKTGATSLKIAGKPKTSLLVEGKEKEKKDFPVLMGIDLAKPDHEEAVSVLLTKSAVAKTLISEMDEVTKKQLYNTMHVPTKFMGMEIVSKDLEKGEITVQAKAHAGDVKDAPDGPIMFDGTGWISLGEDEMPLSVADVVNNPSVAVKKETKIRAVNIWRGAVLEWAEEHDKKIKTDYTQKQKGQLNKIAQKISFDHDWVRVMRVCVSNWVSFCKFANMQTGKSGYPLQPDIDRFFLHANLACGYYDKHLEKSDTKCKTPKLKITKKKLDKPKITNPEMQELYTAAFGEDSFDT
jgi:DNA-binding transcriptional regulator YhcF (GntR family)